jgi:hypothetical protein
MICDVGVSKPNDDAAEMRGNLKLATQVNASDPVRRPGVRNAQRSTLDVERSTPNCDLLGLVVGFVHLNVQR